MCLAVNYLPSQLKLQCIHSKKWNPTIITIIKTVFKKIQNNQNQQQKKRECHLITYGRYIIQIQCRYLASQPEWIEKTPPYEWNRWQNVGLISSLFIKSTPLKSLENRSKILVNKYGMKRAAAERNWNGNKCKLAWKGERCLAYISVKASAIKVRDTLYIAM